MTNATTYLKVSAINLALVLAGALICPPIVKSIDLIRVVHAQDDGKSKVASKIDSKNVPQGNYEYISPTIAGGAAAFETLIAHRIASDQMMVNGYDLLKLENNLLATLIAEGRISEADARRIADTAKVDRPLRLQPPGQ